MNVLNLFHYLLSSHRNIYQDAQLFKQNRRPVSAYVEHLVHPVNTSEGLEMGGETSVVSRSGRFKITDNVVDFLSGDSGSVDTAVQQQWEQMNPILLNYQKFLTPYILVNTLSLYNYIGEKTGLNNLRNARVVDVGAGTGQIFGTFFFNQDTLEYFLLDPNLRLLHDHFLRLYPKLAKYPIGHMLCYAENLPFKNDFADLVMSMSSIDHFRDHVAFIKEARRILKPGGHILIASHIDGSHTEIKPNRPPELVLDQKRRSTLEKVWNRLAMKGEFYARKFHNKKEEK